MLCIIPVAFASVNTADLIRFWDFEDGTPNTDYINSEDVTVSATARSTAVGYSGKGYDLGANGDQVRILENGLTFSDLTFCYWHNYQDFTGWIYNSWPGGTTGVWLAWKPTGTEFVMDSGGEYYSSSYRGITSGWKFRCTIRDKTGGYMRFYESGSLYTLQSISSHPTTVTHDQSTGISFGARSDGSAGADFWIDEIMVWDTALTEAEMDAIYEAYVAGDTMHDYLTTPSSLIIDWDSFEPDDGDYFDSGTIEFEFNFTGLGLTEADCTLYEENGASDISRDSATGLSVNTTYSLDYTPAHGTTSTEQFYISCEGDNEEINTTSTKDIEMYINTLPTTPSGSTFNSNRSINTTLTAIGAGSTDADLDSITYYYEFRCQNATGTLLQAKSTNNSWYIQNSCNNNTLIATNIWADDTYNESNSYETIFANIDLGSSIISNLSLLFQTQYNFTSFINYTDINGSVTCGYYLNSPNVTCNTSTSTQINDTVNIYCGFDDYVAEFIEFTPYCTNGTEYNGTVSTVLIDNVNPVIVENFVENSVYFAENVTGQFNFSDIHLYSWNISVNGVEIDSAENVNYTEYIYNLSYDASNLGAGQHYITLEVADGHTANEIPEYDISNGFWNNKFEVDTGENEILVKPVRSSIWDDFEFEKLKDRYIFTYEAANKDLDNLYSFYVTTEQPMQIVYRPETKYKKWIVTGKNWIDFYSNTTDQDKLTIEKINDFTALVTVYSTSDTIEFESVGELNIATFNYTFYTINATASYESSVYERQDQDINLTIDLGGSSYSFNDVEATFDYNGTEFNVTKTSDSNNIYFTADVETPATGSTTNYTFNWNITVTGENETTESFNQTVFYIGIADCADEPTWYEALNITVQDEDTLDYTDNTTINMHLEVSTGLGGSKEFGFEFRGQNNYSICMESLGANYTIQSNIEYWSENTSRRKYFLVDYTLDNSTDLLPLYTLNFDDSSDIVMTVYDRSTGERIEGAYVKILRYYPGQDNDTSSGYRTVEVQRTDVNGETSGKMVLADVWYKYIVEYPAGTVRLNSDIEKLLDVNKVLPITLGETTLLNYHQLIGINTDVSCTKSTKTCRFTWSDSSGIATTGILKVYRDTGFSKTLIHESNLTSSAATLAYTVSENTSGRRYTAEGWIVTNE
jgi:hypothetical protein